MKKVLKFFTACLTAVLLFAAASVPAFADDTIPEEELTAITANILSQLTAMSDEDLEASILYYGDSALGQGFSEWKALKADTGDYVGINSVSYSETEDGSALISAEVSFTEMTCDLTLTFSSSGISGISIAKQATLGEKMKDASVNLVVGMGTVFLVLIFLCWVISLFKYVGKLESKLTGKEKKTAPAPGPVSPAVSAAKSEAGSEEELRAVIAAAIAAYEADTGMNIEKQPSLNNGLIIKTYRRN